MSNIWIIFALSAAFIYTFVAFVDKYVISVKPNFDFRGMPMFQSLMGFIIGTTVWFAAGQPVPHHIDGLILIITGVITIFAGVFYFKALSLEETSKLFLLFQITPLFILVGAWLFIKETITVYQFLGFMVILIAVIIISTHKKKQSFQLSKALISVLIADFLWAASALLVKAMISKNSFTIVLCFESWGLGLGGFILYAIRPSFRHSFNHYFRTMPLITFIIIGLNESCFVIGKAFGFFAAMTGPISLVSIIISTQVIIGSILGMLAAFFWPKIFKEDLHPQALLVKWLCTLMVFGGVFLLR